MGGFTIPNFAGNPAGSQSSLPQMPPPPTFTSPSSGAPSGGSRYTQNPSYRDFTFAGGGALPGQNKIQTQPTIDPTLTNDLLNWLHSQLGQGLPQFNQSVNLPSGGSTAPGQLSAPMNPIMQQLQDFMTGKSGPGSLPGVLPMWQSEMAAMQAPIEQNMANIREQFGSMGALGSSEMGTSMQDYMSQTSADEMALLTSATMSSLPQMLSAGMDVQGIDQSAINRAYQQFMTDLPQNNPLLPDMMSSAFTYPGTYNKPPSFLQSLLPSAGGLLSAGASGASAGLAAAGAGSGTGGAILAGLAAL